MQKNPPENSALINVCIIPPEQVGNQCVALAQLLKAGTMSALDGKTRFPHMTVCMVRVDKDSVASIIEAVDQALKSQKSFLCKHVGCYQSPGRYFEISYGKSPEFMVLHELLLETLKGYRLNPGNPYQESYFGPYDHEQQDNARETGYDLAHGRYRPHVTLLRWQEGQVPASPPELPKLDLSFQLSTICVYLADENGAVYEELARFSIS